jgi:hypothetical protein
VRVRRLAALAAVLLCVGCAATDDPVSSASSPGRNRSSTPSIEVRGTFVKFTNFPCHRSDPYVGNEVVVFHGSDGSRTTTRTGNASWIGSSADPPVATLGQCRQVAAFEVRLPIARRYSIEINDGRLPPLTLATIRAARFRVRLLVGARPGSP